MKLPILEWILFCITGLLGFPIFFMVIIVVFAFLGDPQLQRFKWFKSHADAFPTNYRESLYMNGSLFLFYGIGLSCKIWVMNVG